jgi:1-deoxy-D-xylulose-5-phosphate reductoisomerase
MAAIVGASGLLPTLAAVKAGKKVLLANKESLVMAGALFMAAVKQSGAQLLPIDSEHNAIFQCLPLGYTAGTTLTAVKKVILTCSGGPFLDSSAEAIAKVTPEQACNHPRWSMGKKISVDSATLMNKGLEFIEACWLFALNPDAVDVVIHPQSIVHSMVEYSDGSVLAQLGNPDMRIPIAHALAWPNRISSGVSPLDLVTQEDLQFQAPDLTRFPTLSLSMEAAAKGMGATTVLNAANEVAVDAFLKGQLGFSEINHLLSEVMITADYREPDSIDAVLDLDTYARGLAHHYYRNN